MSKTVKPCPYCGRPPVIKREGMWKKLKCVYVPCHMKPETVWAAKLVRAKRDWNERAHDK